MKLMYAGIEPQASPEKWRYNCNINRNCQKKYYMPIDDISALDLYVDLPVMPSSFNLIMVDYCNDVEYPLTPSLYVVGENQRGFYGVFSSLVTGAKPNFFYIRAEFIDGSFTHIFYSHDFSTTDCGNLTRVEACYNNPTVGTEAFDINDIYYGFPITSNVLGNPRWRYFHSVYVRYGNIANTQHKLSITMFNSKKAYKTTSSKIFNFSSEVVPAFYKDIIFGVIARGNILVNGQPWQVGKEVSINAHSEESGLWVMDIPLEENKGSYFSCKETVCRALLPEDENECCDAVVQSATSEIVADETFVCKRYNIYGLDNTYVNYTDCASGLPVTGLLITNGNATEVCSRTRPDGDESMVQIVEIGNC